MTNANNKYIPIYIYITFSIVEHIDLIEKKKRRKSLSKISPHLDETFLLQSEVFYAFQRVNGGTVRTQRDRERERKTGLWS